MESLYLVKFDSFISRVIAFQNESRKIFSSLDDKSDYLKNEIVRIRMITRKCNFEVNKNEICVRSIYSGILATFDKTRDKTRVIKFSTYQYLFNI